MITPKKIFEKLESCFWSGMKTLLVIFIILSIITIVVKVIPYVWEGVLYIGGLFGGFIFIIIIGAIAQVIGRFFKRRVRPKKVEE